MRPSDWFVVVASMVGLAWVYWYFFVAEGRAAPALSTGGGQEIAITVHGGYEPSTVRARAGAPLRLVFDRQEKSGCSEEVVFGDFGVRRFLPAFEKTTVELGATKPGTYEFTCGMGMLRGKLILE